MQDERTKADRTVVLVTGPSGSGRSTAIRALEDIGYEVIDNMPLRLLEALLEAPAPERPMALGIDPRTRDFSVQAVEDALGLLGRSGAQAELLFLDCDTRVLLRRFSETRRRHPLAGEGQLEAAIERELEILAPLRERADIRIDTSATNMHELRAAIETHFAAAEDGQMAVSVQSFSYKRGVPGAVDMVFDCRFLQNPYWQPDLRALSGQDAAVRDFIRGDARFEGFRTRVEDLCLFLLPAHKAEGKSHLAIAFGCTGGQHRSVALAEIISEALAEQGWPVSIRHRELNARAAHGEVGGVIGIVIVAHGGLAREYLAAIEHVVGAQDGIRAIAIEPSHDRDLKQREICDAADQVDDGQGVVVVTDLFGGSPSNLSLRACRPQDRRILYGANLPMLIKLAKSRHLAVPEAVRAALNAGRKYIDSQNVGDAV